MHIEPPSSKIPAAFAEAICHFAHETVPAVYVSNSSAIVINHATVAI